MCQIKSKKVTVVTTKESECIVMKKKTTILILFMLLFTQVMSFTTGCASKNTSTNEVVNDRETITKDSNKDSNPDISDVVVSETVEEEASTNDVYSIQSNSRHYTDTIQPYDPDSVMVSTEEYAAITENPFISTTENDTSTFSADVDTASYSNIRRMINNDCSLEEIPKDAVRIEEMLNYFSYDYATPKEGEPFGVSMESTICPWNPDHNIIRVGLSTQKVDFTDTPDSNIVFLLDVSGSMSDSNKLPLLTKAFSLFTNELGANDKISIVTYAGEDKVVLEGVSGNDKDTILTALENLEASGSTNGSAGIETAYQLAKENFIKGGNNRVILATDGDLNVGITDNAELEDFISQKRKEGIFLSTLGFGMGNYKDAKLELLADKGNGNYAYIDNLTEAKKVMVEEMGANFTTVAKDVKFQVAFDPNIIANYRLIGYENRVMENADFENDKKDAGEIGSGHSVTALYEVEMTENYKMGENLKEHPTADYYDCNWMTLKIRYKEPDEEKSKELSYNCLDSYYTPNPSKDLSFAMAVAEFGLLLRDSTYKGEASFDNVIQLAKKSDTTADIYKSEFVKLVNTIAMTN